MDLYEDLLEVERDPSDRIWGIFASNMITPEDIFLPSVNQHIPTDEEKAQMDDLPF